VGCAAKARDERTVDAIANRVGGWRAQGPAPIAKGRLRWWQDLQPELHAKDTVSSVKAFPRLRAREAVLDAICGSRLRQPFQAEVCHIKRFRRPDRRHSPI
jgi:hypothetical protein